MEQAVFVRMTKEVREALEKAARDDDRKAAALMRHIITTRLRELGYLRNKKVAA